MDRIASLVSRADVLSKSIYSSLPFEERLAHLFVKIALDTTETLGRALGAEFLLRGVTGMPDPGPLWDPKARNPELTLPKGYMNDFASSTYGLLMKKFHDRTVADEAVQRFLLKATSTDIIKAVPRRSAESYVRDGIIKQALDVVRHRRRVERPDLTSPLDEPSAEGRSLAELVDDPRALKQFHHSLSPRVWQAWMTFLARHVHEDIPRYIGLSMMGYSDAEIVGSPNRGKPGMLPNYTPPASGPNSYIQHFVGKIPEMSKAFFEGLHEDLRDWTPL